MTAFDAALVTGATGLLGSNIVRGLVAEGTRVLALVREPDRARRLLPDGVGLIVGDVLDVPGFAGRLAGVDAVFHTAAYFREYYRPGADLDRLRRTNVDAVGELLRAAAAAGVGVFVHTSTIGTLAPGTPAAPSDESSAVVTTDNHYFRSKIEADALVGAFTGDIRVVTVLPSWMWGPGDAGPSGAGGMFLSVASGAMSAVPKAAMWVVDARDVADAAIRAADSGTGRYVVAGVRRELPDMIAEIAAAVPCPAPRAVPLGVALAASGLMELTARVRRREPVATRRGVRVLADGNRRWLSSRRAGDELGVTFRGFERTARDVAGWYREHGMLGA